MATYSLINVYKEENNLVDGSWLQDHIGTLESAINRAIEIEKVNSNKIDIAVVDQIYSATPILTTHYNMKRLDTSRRT